MVEKYHKISFYIIGKLPKRTLASQIQNERIKYSSNPC